MSRSARAQRAPGASAFGSVRFPHKAAGRAEDSLRVHHRRHWTPLDAKGTIGPQPAPGRKLAEFFGNVIVAATLPNLP